MKLSKTIHTKSYKFSSRQEKFRKTPVVCIQIKYMNVSNFEILSNKGVSNPPVVLELSNNLMKCIHIHHT